VRMKDLTKEELQKLVSECSDKTELANKLGYAYFNGKVSKKITELDGKQHELPDRKLSDARKDAFLISQGWQVHRIKWKYLTKEFREEVKDRLIQILK
jgi:very-short-patch-repair endonuclease